MNTDEWIAAAAVASTPKMQWHFLPRGTLCFENKIFDGCFEYGEVYCPPVYEPAPALGFRGWVFAFQRKTANDKWCSVAFHGTARYMFAELQYVAIEGALMHFALPLCFRLLGMPVAVPRATHPYGYDRARLLDELKK
jgi:hypothetical protein